MTEKYWVFDKKKTDELRDLIRDLYEFKGIKKRGISRTGNIGKEVYFNRIMDYITNQKRLLKIMELFHIFMKKLMNLISKVSIKYE